MSIFKESFKGYLKKQIGIRQEIIGSGIDPITGKRSGQRDNLFYTYNSRQCVLRLSSGVNIEEDTFLESGEVIGSDMAKRYILEGGIKQNFTQNENTVSVTPRGGFAKTGGAYGDPDLRANTGDDGFGIVPMPGIKDANIRTKSAYGSLRSAKVKFVCFNQRQLEILELLYMRPGYTLLLEWQWTPFINNDKSLDNTIYGIKDFFSKNNTTSKIMAEIYNNRLDSGGNYDAIIGYCKNFKYTLREDGGYDCETEIIAKGEILESLKLPERSIIQNGNADGKSDLEDLFDEIIEWSDQVDEANDYSSQELLNDITEVTSEAAGFIEKKARQFWNFGVRVTDWIESEVSELVGTDIYDDSKIQSKTVSTSDEDLYSNKIKTNLQDPDEVKEMALRTSLKERMGVSTGTDELFPVLIPKDSNFFTEGDFDLNNADDTTTDFTDGDNEDFKLSELDYNTTYIRWDALVHCLNSEIIPKAEKTGKPLFIMQTAHVLEGGTEKARCKPLLYTRTSPSGLENKVTSINDKKLNYALTDISSNPSVCLLPHLMYDYAKTQNVTNLTLTNKNGKAINNPASDYWAIGPESPYYGSVKKTTLTEDEKRRNIGNIYFGVEYLRYTLRDMYYTDEDGVNPDFTLLKYLKKIWNDVNDACGGNHNFEINVDHEFPDHVRVVDLQATQDDLINTVHELKIQSPDSIVRNVSYNSSIPKALTSTIAVAAQAPDSIDDLDAVSFAAINKGIYDRFAVRDDKNYATGANAEAIKKWKNNFNTWMRDLYLAVNYLENDEGGDPVGKYHPGNREGGGILSNFQYDIFIGRQASKYDSDEKKVTSPAKISEARGALADLRRAITNLNKVYGSDKGTEYYLGQPIKNPKNTTSSIIPLKFNAKLDGIGGIVIGNVFKIAPDRLPKGYQGKDVHFIVMGEEQNIDGKQDWTTTINGHLILLGAPDESNGDGGLGSWKKSYQIEDIPLVVYDPDEDQVEELEGEGGPGAGSLAALGPDETTGLYNPLDSVAFTTQYGQLRKKGDDVYRRHRGCDLKGSTGTKMYAMGDGVVSKVKAPVAGDNAGCGGTLKIKFSGKASGLESMYCHCSAIYVKEGDIVTAKQHVANMGGEPGTPGAGNTTGPHLHLAIFSSRTDKPEYKPVDWKTVDLKKGHRYGSGGVYTDGSNNKLKGTVGFSANGTIDPAVFLTKT